MKGQAAKARARGIRLVTFQVAESLWLRLDEAVKRLGIPKRKALTEALEKWLDGRKGGASDEESNDVSQG